MEFLMACRRELEPLGGQNPDSAAAESGLENIGGGRQDRTADLRVMNPSL